jgi:hypothetical protein
MMRHDARLKIAHQLASLFRLVVCGVLNTPRNLLTNYTDE